MANRISVLIDVAADKANRSLSDFRRSVGDADGAVGKFKAGTASLGNSLKANIMPIAAAAGAALVSFAAQSVRAASNLEESMNAVDVVFGEAAEGIHELGESASESFGLSQRAFNEAAVSMAGFARTVAGEGGDVVAVMDDLIGRATDFASVHNIDISEALQKFQSGLAGETEPLRLYNIDLSAAAIKLHAVEKGLISSGDEMSEAVKVQARYSLLMQETDDRAGDFANTQDSLANTTKTLSAVTEDLQAKIGEDLLPVVATAVSAYADLVGAMDKVGIKSGAMGERFSEDRGFLDGLANSAMSAINPLQSASQAYNELNHMFGDSGDAADDAEPKVYGLSQSLVQQSIDAALAESATEELSTATGAMSANVREATEAIDANIAATQEAINKRNEFANATWDAQDAEDSFHDAVVAMTETLETHDATTREGSASVRDAARATDEMVRRQLAAEGVILDSARGQELYKSRLQAVGAEMGGPLAAEISAHVDRLDGIQDGVVTKVTAEMQGIDATRARIEAILGRQITIPVNTYNPTMSANTRYRAGGGRTGPNETTIVGERGPEIAEFPPGTRIRTASETKRMLSGGGATTIVNNWPAGVRADDVANAERRYRRVQGAL